MPEGNSMINLGELSKPATALIEKISDAVGGIFKPYQIKRIAKAEAEAQLIDTETQIQITDLHRRAMHRFVEEEAQKQGNIENITADSLPLLEDHSTPQNVDDDWITNFFDKCRIVSDREMQQLWSRVLANEANSPGTFSRRTVNLIADLDKQDAELFTNLCRFGWMIGNFTPLVFDYQHDVYNQQGINFISLHHLESLSLVQFNGIATFKQTGLPKEFAVLYYGTPVALTMPKDQNNNLDIGHVMLTNAGRQLAPICGSQPLPEFLEFVTERWKTKHLIPVEATEPTDERGESKPGT
ncbi:MAG: DUF2806 domain-containing protein [Planctomycetia bacterium]|jgi:hypothetical protein